MKTRTKAKVLELSVLPTGTRDAVETAIDLAKDGKSWTSGQDKIRPWQKDPAVSGACDKELVEQY
jgi:hypothetical protein